MPKPSDTWNSLWLKSSNHGIDDQTGHWFALSICNSEQSGLSAFWKLLAVQRLWFPLNLILSNAKELPSHMHQNNGKTDWQQHVSLISAFSWLSSALNHWFIKTNKPTNKQTFETLILDDDQYLFIMRSFLIFFFVKWETLYFQEAGVLEKDEEN